MKPKLLVVTSTFPRWPNDTDPPFVFELSKRLTDVFEVTIHTPHYKGALVRETMDGLRVHRFRYCFAQFETLAGGQGIVPKLRRNKCYYLLLPFFLITQFFSLLLLVASIRPDVIHAHWLIPQGLMAVLVKRIFGIPVVVTAHGADVFSLRQTPFIWIKKYIVNSSDRIVTVSQSLARILSEDTGSLVEPAVISMGVDASLFSPDKREEAIREQYGIHGPFLLFVGRLTEKKGVRYLIGAMSLIVSNFPEAKLLIVGHGELEQDLRDQARNCGLEEVVLFVGGVANAQLPVYYATADIFIGPSVQVKGGDAEGFGLTFVEAAMSGCLVIGTRIGGVEDIIEDGDTGFLVAPNDADILAEKINNIIGGTKSFQEMKENGRMLMSKKFDWMVIAKQYTELLCNSSSK